MSRHEIIARWHSDAARTRHGALHLSRPIPFLERLDALNLKHQAVRATKAQSMRQAANSPESAARARGENWPWPSSHIDCYAPPKRASAASLVQRSRTRGAWAGRPASQSAIRWPGVHLPRTAKHLHHHHHHHPTGLHTFTHSNLKAGTIPWGGGYLATDCAWEDDNWDCHRRFHTCH